MATEFTGDATKDAVTALPSGKLMWSLPAFACFIIAIMAPAALFVVAMITGRSGIAGSLPILDLYLSDNFGLEAE